MVYYGMPSKGCAPCRAKKTKCDQSTPSCGQCLRAGRTCTGYRNEQSLVFRDETKKVVGKAQAAKQRDRIMLSAEVVQADRCDSLNRSTRDKAVTPERATVDNQTLSLSLSVPLEEQATCFFFRNFIFPDAGSSRPPLSCMPVIFKQESASSPLSAIVASIGMAGMSNLKKSPDIMVLARQKHVSALRLINSSIRDPESAKSDQMLIAVLLLGLFETVTGSSQESMKSWANHIVGATAIIQVRGRDQLQSDTGRRLFRFLRAQIIIDCIQRLRLIPDKILLWSELPQEDEDVDWFVENRLFGILARFCMLRKAVFDTDHDMRYTQDEARSLAYSIDAEFADWANCLPWEYAYMTRTNENSEDTVFDHYHVYKGFWIAGVWNLYRCARILTNEIIMKILSIQIHSTSKAAQFKAMYRKSVDVASQLSSDIRASIPFYFGKGFSSNGSSNIPMAAAGHAVLWPLFVVCTFPESSSSTQDWAIKQLQKVSDLKGIKQATSLANILRNKTRVTAWDKRELSLNELKNVGYFRMLNCVSDRPSTSQELDLSDAEI